jgi:hypothetical protein
MSELTIIDEAISAFELEHILICKTADMGKCQRKHRQLITRAKAYEAVIENRIKSEIAGEMANARDFFIMKKEVEVGSLAEWISTTFDMAIKILGGKNE